jgi:imidazolonepropionase-like amidohydrolase
VAELVREGWPREEALKALTLHPARLLGLEARLGSIEKGKDADLIFLDADPFDPTARVREVMIAGEIVHRVEDFD